MRARGFTLVEVMVAMAVVAIALPAVLTALYQQIDNVGYLRDKSMAHMVAANKLAETRIIIGSTRSLQAGKDSGQAQLADRDWYWWLETTTTEVEQFFRIEITVAAEEEQRDNPLYTLVAFMSSDLQVDLQGLVPGGGGSGQPDGDPPADSSPQPSPQS
jgi:general secretion pathway protein I